MESFAARSCCSSMLASSAVWHMVCVPTLTLLHQNQDTRLVVLVCRGGFGLLIGTSDVPGLSSEGSGLVKTQTRPTPRAWAWLRLGSGLGQGFKYQNVPKAILRVSSNFLQPRACMSY